MNDSQVTKDKLVSDFKAVVADTEELLKLTAGQAGDKVADVRVRLTDKLTSAKYKLQDLEAAVVQKTKAAARATDDYVQQPLEVRRRRRRCRLPAGPAGQPPLSAA
jgi:ElaB/YqjD/DUF883 family membrane-anchored ribosome-binding protein